MAIIFGSDAGIRENSYSTFVKEIVSSANKFADAVSDTINLTPGRRHNKPLPKEEVYVDNGFENVPGTSFVDSTLDNVDDIKKRRIISQEPSLTVYIKKRAFSSLSGENDSRFMDKGEKLYLRASKVLFG